MVRTIADTVNAINEQGATGGSDRSVRPTIFLARITGSTAITGKTATVGGVAASPVAWTYDWEEAYVKAPASITAGTIYATGNATRRKSSLVYGTAGKAINTIESMQCVSGTTVLGPGITTANIPAGFSVKAIQANTIVIMHQMQRDNGEPCFVFSCPNAIDGACP
jgi:hypothetical protein